MDFTLRTYKKLIEALSDQGFLFQTFSEFLMDPHEKSVILRHDVDNLPENSLAFAEIQNSLGIKGSYYFRILPPSWNENTIKKISELGHEIGYHYEDLSYTAGNYKNMTEKELIELAIISFKKNLDKLRLITPVHTICMHGDVLSKWDNRLLWKYYNYKDYGILGEPYFDICMEKHLYFTDTGRKWDGHKVSFHDKAKKVQPMDSYNSGYGEWIVKPKSGSLMNMDPASFTYKESHTFKSTNDIINALKQKELSGKLMLTFHPQRWTDNYLIWTKILICQNIKNLIKYYLIVWENR